MKMNTKRISLLLAVLMLATLLASCANTGGDKANNSGNKTEAKDVKVAETKDVEAALEDDNSLVLDARSNDQFNGWALDGDKRGGHIEGATDFSAYWIMGEYDEKDNLEGDSREDVLAYTMKNKDITPDKTVIVYDTNDKDAKVVAKYLEEKGVKDVSVYNAKEWIDDDSKELVSNPNYELFLPPEKVMELTEGKEVEPIKDSKNVKIIDVRWGDEKESGYLDGHIPGAVHVNTDSFEPPKAYVDGIEEWRLTDDDSLVKLLLDNGITHDSSVVVTSPEPLAATRFATICRYLGVEDVYVLNGGFVNWQNKGFELSKDSVKPEKVADFGAEYPANPDVITTIPELKELLKDDNFNLVDNRTWEEYIGESSGYSYHDKKGRIPGAIFGYAGKNDSSSMSYYRNLDKTIRNIDEIRAMWDKQGIDTSKKTVFMCGSGWRAAEVYWDARVMGLKDISLYSDGWIAWSNEGNPSETGDPTK
ncbi:MAG: rhodanese-like domain-containing protein [Peptoniphilus sp.]|nr:rhodanese-like domain-containing protein [Peptoniphilus sp.]MDD7362544.1 rhodanese-like domain-containing protein [Bacillota bacterium]MDY6045057.1 rhodanese-like domain-containing protein [Peptoniphilus sp.]